MSAEKNPPDTPPPTPGPLKLGRHHVPLPASRWARMGLGGLLVVGGLLGFLPILGFWMIPLGLLVLSHDLPMVRRWRRATAVKLGLWLKPRYPQLASLIGFDNTIAPRRVTPDAASPNRNDKP